MYLFIPKQSFLYKVVVDLYNGAMQRRPVHLCDYLITVSLVITVSSLSN